MKPHESPRINKKSIWAIPAIRGLCGIGVLHVPIPESLSEGVQLSQRQRNANGTILNAGLVVL